MKRQQGVALITALLVTAIATIAATTMMARQQLDIRRSGNIYAADQAWLFAQGLENWAIQIMEQDRKDNQTDHLGENWATVLPPIGVEGGVVSGAISDLQGRLNLNNLVDDDGVVRQADVDRLRRLFDILDIDNNHVQAVVDWLDRDEETTFPDGAEDNVYLGREVAYRTANRRMSSPSELLLVAGIRFEDYLALRPYVCALPKWTPVNVNTASAVVLQAVVPELPAADAEQLVSEREDNPFTTVGDFRNHSLIQPHLSGVGNTENGNTDGLSVSSEYFLLNAGARYERADVRMASVIARDERGTWILQHGLGDY
jgi:general secretion pathway protein K